MASIPNGTEYTAPKSQLPYPPIHKNAKFVVLSDWDGTITSFDSNDHLTDNYGFGKERRRELNIEILKGKTTFRDAFIEMLDSIPLSYEQCRDILVQDVKLDPGFADFYAWCKENEIPVTIVSSGMTPWIRAVLSKLIGEEEASKIEVICNDVEYDANGRWHIKFRHPESGFGHDKSQAILPYRDLENPPTLFFFGDGVSDMSAAKHADLLFCKVLETGESDLARYCDTHGVPYLKFHTFKEVLPVVKSVVLGEKKVEEVLGKVGAV
ncbi:hypothetical protein CPB86DRAFT_97953 [Serendipita vermifera]|nr:hypothetical protein CPB86DRAFT_97953 [Serendipita vermifera]